MKQIPSRLQSWWYATMVPEQAPAITVDQREQRRKRRLLSLIVLFQCVITAPWVLVKGPSSQQALVTVSMGAFCVSLLINQRGYLKAASWWYLLTSFFALTLTMINLSQAWPLLSFLLWPLFLALLVIVSFLLPSWGPLLLAGIQMVFLVWFVLIERRSQVALFLPTLANQLTFLGVSFIIILLVSVLCTISALMTQRAGIQANRMVELEQAYHQISEAYTNSERQALTDGLTNLPNHRAVIEQLGKEMERARRHTRPFSLLFFDVDRFKKVNDTYGHAAGDIVLRQVGERARHCLRKEDTLGRFGGEEFVVLLSESDRADAETAAERIRTSVAASPIALSESLENIRVTVSIGLATYPIDGDDEEMMLLAADKAMYLAKRMGRNQVRTAEDARQKSADVELMTLLEEEKKQDEVHHEGHSLTSLREMYTLKIVSSLTCLLEQRDENMSAHAYGVSDLATALAQKMNVSDEYVYQIGIAALLHDIGKVAIPDVLLKKTGVLSPYEQTLIEDHAELGAQILEASPFLFDLAPAVRYHHEHWDGSGYPEHLNGANIPLAARIIAVAEAYDAMQRDYPYQQRCSAEEALIEIQHRAGQQFDRVVVESLSTLFAQRQALEAVSQRMKST